MLRPGVYAAASETYTGTDRPDGEWQLLNRTMRLTLVNRFAKDQVERCTVSWRARGENRVTLALWSRQTLLSPGQSLQLNADYSVSAPGYDVTNFQGAHRTSLPGPPRLQLGN